MGDSVPKKRKLEPPFDVDDTNDEPMQLEHDYLVVIVPDDELPETLRIRGPLTRRQIRYLEEGHGKSPETFAGSRALAVVGRFRCDEDVDSDTESFRGDARGSEVCIPTSQIEVLTHKARPTGVQFVMLYETD